jgi:DNA-binding response OmpR family regulator
VSSSRSVLPPEPADEHLVRARAQDRTWSAMVGALLLVADPDGGVGSPLDVELHAAGLSTVWCRDGADTLVEYGRRGPEAVLAAPRLEVVDTPTVVGALRSAGCRTVLVGVGPHDVDLAGPALVAGASGIVARPYDADEIAQRLEPELHELEHRVRLVYGPLELDPWAYRVRAGGEVIENLPLKEFKLLRLLMAHADHVVAAEQIRAALWGEGAPGPSSNAITVHVGRLRHRLEGVAEIRTIRGRGYRLTV